MHARSPYFRQRVNAVDDWPDLAAEYELQRAVEFAHGSHEGPERGLLFGEKMTKIERGLVASGGAARHQAAGGRERFQALPPRRRSDMLHHHIDAPARGEAFDLGGDVLAVMVDDMVGAER